MSLIKNEKVSIAQQNGQSVTLKVSGDEFYARYENDDGYTVVYDTKQGVFCYANLLEKGELVSSEIPISQSPPSDLRRHLHESPEVRASKHNQKTELLMPRPASFSPDGVEPTIGWDKGLLFGPKIHSGKIRGLTVLVEFQDMKCHLSKKDVYSMFNDDGYKGNGNYCSIREYFLLMSGKKLDYSNEVFGPIKLKHERMYYRNRTTQELLDETFNALVAQGINFEPFDCNKDGKIDAINILYAGEAEYGGYYKGNVFIAPLWPHNFIYEKKLGKVSSYFYQICNLDNRIGTICHENGHMLCRFPDLYDYGNRDNDLVPSSGLGTFCLMSAGNWLNNGLTPAPVSAYFRRLAGWCKEVSLNKSGVYSAVHGDYSTVHKFDLKGLLNEYFLVENRSNLGLDTALPSGGLAVYHCDIYGSNEWQDGTPSKHYQCALLQADGVESLEHNSRNWGDKGDLYQKVSGVALSYATTPSSRRWDRSDSGLILANISQPGLKMTFEIK